jgi:hypothetical protein
MMNYEGHSAVQYNIPGFGIFLLRRRGFNTLSIFLTVCNPNYPLSMGTNKRSMDERLYKVILCISLGH